MRGPIRAKLHEESVSREVEDAMLAELKSIDMLPAGWKWIRATRVNSMYEGENVLQPNYDARTLGIRIVDDSDVHGYSEYVKMLIEDYHLDDDAYIRELFKDAGLQSGRESTLQGLNRQLVRYRAAFQAKVGLPDEEFVASFLIDAGQLGKMTYDWPLDLSEGELWGPGYDILLDMNCDFVRMVIPTIHRVGPDYNSGSCTLASRCFRFESIEEDYEDREERRNQLPSKMALSLNYFPDEFMGPGIITRLAWAGATPASLCMWDYIKKTCPQFFGSSRLAVRSGSDDGVEYIPV